MSSKQVSFHFDLVKMQGDTTGVAVTWVEDIDAGVRYKFEKNRHVSYHKKLMEMPIIKNGVKAIKSFRNLKVKLQGEVYEEYCDEAGNFVFLGDYLEEVVEEADQARTSSSIVQHDLLELISRLKLDADQKSKIDLQSLLKKFVEPKFDGKNANSADWWSRFEAVLKQNEVQDQKLKIDALRSQLTGAASVWFSSEYVKLGDTNWAEWKRRFEHFGIKTWAAVRTALNYRYISGQLIDYALAKEKILLDIDRTISESMLVNLIVAGLPVAMQEKVSTDTATVTKLREALARIEIGAGAKLKGRHEQSEPIQQSRPAQKAEASPCPVVVRLTNFKH